MRHTGLRSALCIPPQVCANNQLHRAPPFHAAHSVSAVTCAESCPFPLSRIMPFRGVMDTLITQTYFNGEAGLFRVGTELCLSLPKKIAPTDSSIARVLHTARPAFPTHSIFQHPLLPPEFAPTDTSLVPLSRRASTSPHAQRAPTSAPLAKSRPPFAPSSSPIAPPEIQPLQARRGVPPALQIARRGCILSGEAARCFFAGRADKPLNGDSAR